MDVENENRDHIRPLPRIGLAALVVVAFVLGYAGLHGYLRTSADFRHGTWDEVYYDLQLFLLASGPVNGGGHFPWALSLARFLAPAATVWAVIQGIRLLLSGEIARQRTRRLTGHVIVCGDTPTARSLAVALGRTGRVVTVGGAVGGAGGGGVRHVDGDPRLTASLVAAGARGARAVLACAGESSFTLAVAAAAARVARGAAAPLRVHVEVDDSELCLALRARRSSLPRRDGVDLDFLQPQEAAAAALVARQGALSGARPGAAAVVVLQDLGDFGAAVLVNLARRWSAQGAPTPLVVHVVDPDAAERLARVAARFPVVAEHCATTTAPGPLADALAALEAAGTWPPDRVYLCGPDDDAAMLAALSTPYLWRLRPGAVTVRVAHRTELGRVFDGPGEAAEDGLDPLGGKISVVGVDELICDPMVLEADFIDFLAQVIHARYVGERARAGETPASNPSMVPWSELAQELRAANRDQARDLGAKLAVVHAALAPRSAGSGAPFAFSAAELELLAEREHERWMGERARRGWKYGPDRDDATLTHPDMVPWQELTEAARDKDREAVSALPSILGDAGLDIVRVG